MRMRFTNEEPLLRNVDSRGRVRPTTYPDGIQTFDDMLGLPRPRRGLLAHPSYYLDYPWAVSHEYQMLVGSLIQPSICPDVILTLTAGLDFPDQNLATDNYAGMVAYYQAVAEGVSAVRPALAEEVVPFATRHGLNHLPWGLGWLYQALPQNSSNNRVLVPVSAMADIPSPAKPKPVDGRSDPAVDALLVYLRITGAGRDPHALQIVHSVLVPECTEKFLMENCICDRGPWPKALTLRCDRALRGLLVKRGPGRPAGQSKWDLEELYSVLEDYVSERRE